jgi:site-specific DNA-methyltransferase (adenine-specific)
MDYILKHGDCLDIIPLIEGPVNCVFADPPDNIGLGYGEYQDKMPEQEYEQLLADWIRCFVGAALTTWISFNVKWIISMGVIAAGLKAQFPGLEVKPGVQVFTFGQHNKYDFGNNHRPVWRFRWAEAPIYPEQIKVPSWRQLNGDKRAAKGGRVPGDVFEGFRECCRTCVEPLLDLETTAGDVFDFSRVTGNSRQRRRWHPTQLHEDFVDRCIKSCTKEGDLVVDPFAGTGTTLRVCKRINRRCITMDVDRDYCEKIAADNGLEKLS